MPTEVIMPALGMAQDTGKLVRWLRPRGASVTRGEPLMEVETDKVTVEIEAPADGVLASLAAEEGDDVPVGQVVALILAPGEEPAVRATLPAARPGRVAASPKAKRIAAEQGIDLSEVRGSGPRGAVVAADVEGLSSADAAPPLGSGAIWRRMAERTTAAWQGIPHFSLQREVDASRLLSWRDVARRRADAETVTVGDLIIRIAAVALRQHPQVNSSWREGEVVPSQGIHVGIAVALEDGLVVPVVHDADRLALSEIVARRRELVGAARERRLRPDDVGGGTFTISNLGMFGVDAFQAIVNAPQAAILAVGRIRDRAVVLEGAIVARPVMTMTASFDHRVVDGARGARFLETLADLVEEPAALVE
jgi:pyruvate dehydrogenase E2 component (dihydrolipoyllysine-residue acetyltransferase)